MNDSHSDLLLAGLSYSQSLKLDLYRVASPGRPLVICIHGGGFIAGVRDDTRCRQSAALLNQAGFNCASISYSLAPPNDRFACWPRNLFDLADAIAWLSDHAGELGYSMERFGLLGFSAGCCLSNLYIQGGRQLFEHFDYETPLYEPAALAGFYGPYDFPSRQVGRKSADEELNRLHSPSWWLRQTPERTRPPVLHIQGDQDTIVYPDQHQRFQQDYQKRGYPFTAVIAEGFGHSFAPNDVNQAGDRLDLGPELTRFFFQHLGKTGPDSEQKV